MEKTYFITTAIDYANGAPHIGHAYEKVLADIIARYQRLAGKKVYFLTGVDQYGQKVQQSAENEGIHPATFAKKNTKKFIKLWERLNLSYDGWAETTDDRHKRCVQIILQELYDKGQLYKKKTHGFYSIRQEQFLTDKERNEQGEFGPEWGEVEEREEENWYFKLSEHAGWLRETVESDALGILPAFKKSEVLNAVERAGETDLCISRPKERLMWGIEFPFDTDYVTYVWFDALINYVSFAGYKFSGEDSLPEFETLWPANLHVIGKDILIPPHSIYWPCMLHAMGFESAQMPDLLVHGFWTNEGEKMSKSLGNVVDPNDLCDEFGEESLRYFLARNIITGRDSDFSKKRLVEVFNDELANNLGNLLNRSLTLMKKGFASEVPEFNYDDESCAEVRESFQKTSAEYAEKMNAHDLSGALGAINNHITLCNQFAERNKPWELLKDEAQKDKVAAVLYHMIESCAQAALLLEPFVPQSAEKILSQTGLLEVAREPIGQQQWGVIQAGTLFKKPKPVFPRLELPA